MILALTHHLILALASTTCGDLKGAYQQGTCCGEDILPTHVIDTASLVPNRIFGGSVKWNTTAMSKEDVTAHLNDAVNKNRAESGNDFFYFSFDTEESDRIIFIEQWRDDHALQEHFTLPQFNIVGTYGIPILWDTYAVIFGGRLVPAPVCDLDGSGCSGIRAVSS